MSSTQKPSPWPTHPDGRAMTLGEMTPEQRRQRTAEAVQRFSLELQRSAPAIARVLADFDREQAPRS